MYQIVYHPNHDMPWKVWLGNRMIEEFSDKYDAEEYLDYMDNIESYFQFS